MVWLPRNKKQTHWLNSRLQMWPSGLTLAMTLTLNFQGQIPNWLYLRQKWCDGHETKSKHIDWSQDLKCDHQVWPWPWPWPWIFKVKCRIDFSFRGNQTIFGKHISWTLGLKCDHQIWPWPWPWLWIFKVKYKICYISTRSGPIATKQKANISIWTLGLKCDNGFDLGHDIDIWIYRGHMWFRPFGDQGQV